MRVASTYSRPQFLVQPLRVIQTEPLVDAQFVEQSLAAGSTFYVSRFVKFKPFVPLTNPVVVSPAVAPDDKTAEDVSPQKVTLADFTKNVGIGGALAAAPLSVIPLAKHATQAQLATQLTNYGFAPDASSQLASSALNFARSNLGHLCCVFLAGSAVTMGTVEALKPDWEWKRKLILSGIGGTILFVIAAILIYLGVWGSSARNDQKVVPIPTKADSKPVTP